jgi:YceI-like domain
MKYILQRFLLACAVSLTAVPAFAGEIVLTGTWNLKESSVAYAANHTLKKARGVSVKTRGKGRCGAQCEILLAVPVASFDSGDSNRDLHMLEATKGALFPVITARSNFKAATNQNKITVNLEIEFAGKKSTVKDVVLTITASDKTIMRVDGNFILKVSDFGITRPSLLGMTVDDEVPVTLTSTWELAK